MSGALPPRTLVLAVGNPSRGDDALGFEFAERARARWAARIAAGELEVLTDFQLQVEHALDLADRDRVLFVDASVAAPPPCAVEPVGSEVPPAFSHSMSPAALLGALDRLGRTRPARVEILAIRAESFELGAPLSPAAARHLEEALRAADRLLGWSSEPGRRLRVAGVVQGVGFRPFVARAARSLGLAGRVWNGPGGVVVEAWGPPRALDALVSTLQAPPPGAAVRSVDSEPLEGDPPGAFEIAPSEPAAGPARLSIPPDLALCPDCRREIEDPADRHHDHPFTGCTACGPRLSIVTGLPYDRARTTMAAFEPCADCRREHDDPEDRRHHAQAIACPACGPRLSLRGADGAPIPGHPLDEAARLLGAGGIVAVQALGGFHLACDATSSPAVRRLRARKRREARPLAVMVADLDAAEALGELGPEARAALASAEGPIALVPARSDPRPPLAPEVAAGTSRLGLFLPTTPLHARLLARFGPLVMTSANLSGEPIATDPGDPALALADAVLSHDRPIARRVEDSVVAFDPGLPPLVLRRARGFAPRPIRLPVAAPCPILAVGGHLKTTAAVVVGDECWLTPHLGDLESHASEQAWAREVEGFEALLGVRGELLVHDAHPDYATTRYAEARGGRRLAVQHHHAHALAVLAERRVLEPALVLALDGTGWGPDGTAWGGEILRVEGLRLDRLAALRPIPLPGGERAVREAWRAAYGALFDAFGGEAPEIAERIPGFSGPRGAELRRVHRALEQGVGVARARGLGRVFDAAGSLALGRARSSFEGEIPLRLEDLADGPARPYPFEISARSLADPPVEIDLRPTWRALVSDLVDRAPAASVSARLHATVVEALLAAVSRHHLASGLRRVVLTGGCLQNRRLRRSLRDALGEVVLDPVELPVHDGGLALGQALAGALSLAGGG